MTYTATHKALCPMCRVQNEADFTGLKGDAFLYPGHSSRMAYRCEHLTQWSRRDNAVTATFRVTRHETVAASAIDGPDAWSLSKLRDALHSLWTEDQDRWFDGPPGSDLYLLPDAEGNIAVHNEGGAQIATILTQQGEVRWFDQPEEEHTT